MGNRRFTKIIKTNQLFTESYDMLLKKTYLILVLCLFIVTLSGIKLWADCLRGSGGGAATDYTADGNCVGAWFMNGTSGETDRTSNGEDLTLSGTMARETDVPGGYSGYSRNNTSSSANYLYVNDGGSTDLSGADQNVSIVGWIKIDDTNHDYVLAAKGNPVAEACYRVWYDNASGSMHAALSDDGSTFSEASGATSLSTDTWYHVAMVYNDTDIRIYLNGSLDSNGASNPKTYSSGLYTSSQVFRLGRSGSDYLIGNIDDVAVFSDALSSAEVTEIYTYGLDGSNGGND
jgi:hypothetical protein